MPVCSAQGDALRGEFSQKKIWIRGRDDEVAEPACASPQADDPPWVEGVIIVFVPPLPGFVRVLDIGEGYFSNGEAKEENADKRGVDAVFHV